METLYSTWSRFDLLITDLNMADMTDSQLMREVNSIQPDIPILLGTNELKAIFCNQIKALESTEFISMSADFEQLPRKIDDLFNWIKFWSLKWA